MMTQQTGSVGQIYDAGQGVFAIDTHYVRAQLDASHLIVSDGLAAFVDTGTSHSVEYLLDALDVLSIGRAQVRYILLTHIHLDHAGGAGALLDALPNAEVVIHPYGARHMAAPRKLIAGAKAVYGDAQFEKLYGEIVPIPKSRIISAEDGQTLYLGSRALSLLFVEGHARHHYCIHDATAEAVFSGDSFGISYRELDSDQGAFIFPTTTPVHFDPPAAHQSIDLICGLGPRRVFLTHYSEVTDVPRLANDLHADIDAFVAIARRYQQDAQRTRAIESAMFEYLNQRLDDHGSSLDEAARRTLLGMDVTLNTQGIEHWLDRYG